MNSRVEHPIPPVFDCDSKILILGSFPSVKSREGEFFYHHPQNRFWKVISLLYQEALPSSIEEKKTFLLRNNVAVWDVIKECDITGSSDSSIKNVVPNDLNQILRTASIQKIAANGGTSYKLYMKHLYPITGQKIIKLPSTSSANAAYSLEKLVREWRSALN